MKNLIITIMFMAVTSMSCAQTTGTAAISWGPSTSTDVMQYNIYLWQGADTTACPLVENASINVTQGLGGASIFIASGSDTSAQMPYNPDGVTWLRAAGIAVDTSYNTSPMCVSKYLKAKDQIDPDKPAWMDLEF